MHRDVVDPILARPPVYSLLIAVPDLVDTGEIRWSEGFSFAPDSCALSGAALLTCHGDTAALNAEGRTPTVDGDPFVVWAADKCSTMGALAPATRADARARATRSLLAAQSFEVAQELWSGAVAQQATPDLVNHWLTEITSDVLSPTGVPMTPTGALACLEQGLGECGRGRRGLIHVSPQLLTHLSEDRSIHQVGNLWLTAMGNIVVADAGYSGAPPDNYLPWDGSSQWAYATSMMQVMLGPVESWDGVDTIDRSVNTATVYVERLAAIKWDYCCHLAAEVNLPRCAFGGVS